jgi:hypothetical protein
MHGKQPIDGEPTEAKAQRYRLRNDGANWSKIRRQWSQGESPTLIARQHGVAVSSVYKHANKENWPQRPGGVPRKKPDSEAIEGNCVATIEPEKPLRSAISLAVKERLSHHFSTVLSTVSILQRGVDEHANRRLEVEELKTLANTLDTVDKVARRTFGLDSPGSGSPGSLLATVAPAVLCPVLDAEPVPAQVATLPPPA